MAMLEATMAQTNERDLRLVHPPPRENRKVVPNEVLGTLIFVLAEIMMFAGFISAFIVAGASVDAWPPPNQPRLPIEETAINTAALLLSGAITWWAGRRHRAAPESARMPMLAAMVLGAFFVVFQGFEWWGLLSDGLGFTTSTHASFFYLIVGAHAVHAICGLGVLVWMFARLQRGTLTADAFWAGRIFWYFVVGLWPILYWQVYLT